MTIVTREGEVARVAMEEPVWGHGCLLIPGGLMIAGGFQGNYTTFSNKTRIYNFKTEKWEEAADMISARASFSRLVLLNDEVWIFGGLTLDGVTANIERFSLRTRQWQEAGSMSTPRAGHAVTSIPTEEALKDVDPTVSLQAAFWNPIVDGLDFYQGGVTIALIQPDMR